MTWLWILILLWAFHQLYIYSMAVYRAFLLRRLKWLALISTAPLMLLMFLVDLVAQFTVASIAFAELPRGLGFKRRTFTVRGRSLTVPVPVGEWLVTHRLRRYIRTGAGWRHRVAHALCHYLLDQFDPTGAHCDSDPPALPRGQ